MPMMRTSLCLLIAALALARMDGVHRVARIAGLVGLVTTGVSLVAAFLPTSDITSVAVFESKLVVGVIAPTAVGWFLFKRSSARPPQLVERKQAEAER